MRTTIRLDSRLLAEAKKLAAETHRTLTSVIEDALRALLHRRVEAAKRTKFRAKTFRGDGLRAGVDLDDNAALRDLLDDRR